MSPGLLVRRIATADFLSPARSRRILIALAAAFVLALIYSSRAALPADSVLLSGDFPAFYAAGKIAAKDGGHLYDEQLQSRIQHEALPERSGYLAYAYPPWFAAIFAPLSLLSFSAAKLCWSLFLFAATVLAARLLAGRFTLEGALALLLLPPLLHANVAGQNTAVSLLCLIVIQRLLSHQALRGRALFLGIACAFFCFKPQYGLIASLWAFCFLRREKGRFCLSLGGSLAILYAVSARVTGWNWLSEYLRALRLFAAQDGASNGAQMISLPSLFSALPNQEILLSILLIGLMLRGAFHSRGPEVFLPPAIVLCAPHVLYYDAALLLPLALVLPKRNLLYAASFLISFVTILERGQFGTQIGAQPITLLALALFIIAAREQEFGRFNKVEVSESG